MEGPDTAREVGARPRGVDVRRRGGVEKLPLGATRPDGHWDTQTLSNLLIQGEGGSLGNLERHEDCVRDRGYEFARVSTAGNDEFDGLVGCIRHRPSPGEDIVLNGAAARGVVVHVVPIDEWVRQSRRPDGQRRATVETVLSGLIGVNQANVIVRRRRSVCDARHAGNGNRYAWACPSSRCAAPSAVTRWSSQVSTLLGWARP